MKKVLTTLGIVGLMVPSAAMAGSLRNDFSSSAMREVGSSVSRTLAEIETTIGRDTNICFENNNWSSNGSINAENARIGGRAGYGAYGDITAAGGAAAGAEADVAAEASVTDELIVDLNEQEFAAADEQSAGCQSGCVDVDLFQENEDLLVADTVVLTDSAEGEIEGQASGGITGSGTAEASGLAYHAEEVYADGSLAWSVGHSDNSAGGTIEERVDSVTEIRSATLATNEYYGYSSDSYTSFSY